MIWHNVMIKNSCKLYISAIENKKKTFKKVHIKPTYLNTNPNCCPRSFHCANHGPNSMRSGNFSSCLKKFSIASGSLMKSMLNGPILLRNIGPYTSCRSFMTMCASFLRRIVVISPLILFGFESGISENGRGSVTSFVDFSSCSCVEYLFALVWKPWNMCRKCQLPNEYDGLQTFNHNTVLMGCILTISYLCLPLGHSQKTQLQLK